MKSCHLLSPPYQFSIFKGVGDWQPQVVYIYTCTVILLHIVMVSPGTHLVKNHESQSRTNVSHLKKMTTKLKMLGPLYNQTDNVETVAKTLHYSLVALKYSPYSTYLKHKKDWNKYASLNNSHRNHTNRILYQKILKSIDRFLRLTGRWGGAQFF